MLEQLINDASDDAVIFALTGDLQSTPVEIGVSNTLEHIGRNEVSCGRKI